MDFVGHHRDVKTETRDPAVVQRPGEKALTGFNICLANGGHGYVRSAFTTNTRRRYVYPNEYRIMTTEATIFNITGSIGRGKRYRTDSRSTICWLATQCA